MTKLWRAGEASFGVDGAGREAQTPLRAPGRYAALRKSRLCDPESSNTVLVDQMEKELGSQTN